MNNTEYPKIDMQATGDRITSLLAAQGYSVKDMQEFFGFNTPQAIYKWIWGKNLPSIDNLFALSRILQTPVDDILVAKGQDAYCKEKAPSALLASRVKPVVSYHYFHFTN